MCTWDFGRTLVDELVDFYLYTGRITVLEYYLDEI